MTRQRLHTDSEVCMYALTVSTIEPKNIKEAMADHSELKFFLGLQVHQSPRGIFISQSQYAIELLKKHGLDECVSMSTPMATERLDVDLQGTPTDQTTYRRMIGGLMYLTASRPDIAFATFVCARYQARPTVKHLKEVKRIFRYLRQSYNMGLWYPKDSGFELIAYSDADHAGCKDDCKSTSGGLQFLGGKLVSWSSKKQDCTAMSTAEAEYVSLTSSMDNNNMAACQPDETVPFEQRYDLMDANKKVDLEHTNLSSTTATANTHNFIVSPPSFFDMVPILQAFMGFTMELRKQSNFKTMAFIAPIQAARLHDGRMIVTPTISLLCVCLTFKETIPYPVRDPFVTTPYTTARLQRALPQYRVPTTTPEPPPHLFTANNIKLPHVEMESTLGNEIRDNLRPLGFDLILIRKSQSQGSPDDSTVIRLRLPERRSTRLTPPAPVPTVDKADEMILQDTLQVSLAEHKSREEQEARENVALVAEHLASKEVEKMVDDSSIPRNDESNIPGTRIEPWSDKESSEVEITKEKEVEISQEMKEEITNIIILVNVTDEDEEINDEVYELKRREKENTVEESRNSPILTPIRSSRIHSNLARFMPRKSFDILADNLYDVMVESLPEIVDKYVKKQVMQKKAKEDTERLISKAILQERGNIQAQILTQIENAIANVIPSQVDASVRNYMSGHILHVHPAQSQTSSIPEQQYEMYLAMKADPQLQQQNIAIWLAL
ncbi:hypothetical protein Tco_0867639 [Tanacetum coccineum]